MSNSLKKGMDTRVEIRKILLLWRKCYVRITNLAISLVLTTSWEQTQAIWLCSPDCFLLGGVQGLGTRLCLENETMLCVTTLVWGPSALNINISLVFSEWRTTGLKLKQEEVRIRLDLVSVPDPKPAPARIACGECEALGAGSVVS